MSLGAGPWRAAEKHAEPLVYLRGGPKHQLFQYLRVRVPFLRVFRPPGHQ